MFTKEDKEKYSKLKDYLTRGSFPIKAGEGIDFEDTMRWVVSLGKRMADINIKLIEANRVKEEDKKVEE